MVLLIQEICSVTLILFSVIDILGVLPIVVELRNTSGELKSRQATMAAGCLMVAFLFVGEGILHLLGTDVSSFAVAGAVVIFAIGMEMIFGVRIFRHDPQQTDSVSIVPLAFPMIAGAGTLTTILALKSEFSQWSILAGIVFNLVIVYVVLKSSTWLEKRIGAAGLSVLRKVFGIVLLSIAVKLFRANLLV